MTAFHNPCSVRANFILIFQRLKLVPPSNFGTSYFADATDIVFDAITSQITHSQTSGSSSLLAEEPTPLYLLQNRDKSLAQNTNYRNLNQSTDPWYQSTGCF